MDQIFHQITVNYRWLVTQRPVKASSIRCSWYYQQVVIYCASVVAKCLGQITASLELTSLLTVLSQQAASHELYCQFNQHHRLIINYSHSLSLSLRFNGHFPGEPGLAGVYWSKGWWRWWWHLDYWSYKSCKAPVKSSPPTNQHPVFYRPDALPVAQPTVSKHWREKYHIPWTCLPQAHLGVFQLCLWPLIAPGYLGGELACLSSALWCQYPKHKNQKLSENIKACYLVGARVILIIKI